MDTRPISAALLYLLSIFLMLTTACQSNQNRLNLEDKGRSVPDFSADSAYRYIQQQVAFGPRSPNTEGHQSALQYLTRKLRSFTESRYVYQQDFTHVGYDHDTLRLTNVIASFNPKASTRILLCAHWDTRPRAEHASSRKDEPILGANDGGSGVGVLLELARLFASNPPPIGVDIVLFDGEDYGKSGDQKHYFLGSRYWANHPPVEGYSPRFGILLDMVGGKNAQFPKEQISTRYAPAVVNEIWTIADQKGFGSLFLDQQGARVSDDHVIINRILNIPTINIIDHEVDNKGLAQFPSYWHTHRDSMQNIDKRTLEGVGRVISELIYNRL